MERFMEPIERFAEIPVQRLPSLFDPAQYDWPRRAPAKGNCGVRGLTQGSAQRIPTPLPTSPKSQANPHE
jgi:hypothetical protein